MGWVLPVASIAASLISGYLNNKNKTSTSSTTSTTTPTFDPAFMPVRDRLLAGAMRNSGGANLARNITNQNLQGVNQAVNAAHSGIAARLAAMGVHGPAAAAAFGNLENSAFSAKVGAMNQEPLLAHDFANEDYQKLLGLLNLGRGATVNSSGRFTGAGSATGGALSDAGSMLGFLYAQGLIGGNKPGMATGSGRLITPGGGTGGYGPGGPF